MTLKSIELIGFKSFGRKSLITFTTPVTSIVGPNGSGKSNIVEAMRFVLGEQSMKSLRGKGGADLIFKGSKSLPSASRASVSIVFDNSNKIFSFTNSGLGVSLDFDEVVISREVFADGTNRYSINDTEVRLKDVIDLLASVNVGSSGHHIISQGEADKVLNASNKDRKSMIEDALGLRVYQYRIRESERKLEKTLENTKEIETIRREIAPHLKFLRKQVQIVEKAKGMQEELRDLYKVYLSAESTYIIKEGNRLKISHEDLTNKQSIVDNKINELKSNKDDNETENEFAIGIKNQELKLREVRNKKDDLTRSLGRIEGIIESLKNQIERLEKTEERTISVSEWKATLDEVEIKINEALATEEKSRIIEILELIRNKIQSLYKSDGEVKVDQSVSDELKQMESERENINSQIDNLNNEENSILEVISGLRQKEKESQEILRDSERVLYELLNEQNKIVSDLHSLKFEEEKLEMIKKDFDMEITEAGVLIGRDVVEYARNEFEGEINRQNQDEMRKKIERIKIKLEDSNLGNSGEVLKEYQETEERDNFLAKELEDLKNSVESIRELIKDLKNTLDKEFKEGVSKINYQFQEFFALMFGGGKASLIVTTEHKRQRKVGESEEEADIEDESEEDFNGLDDESEVERGISIDVSLPQKKVKDLNMLSGGERSLTSIALLFAISQVNPPPFLVLDETDAALDEANSRKYGDMLENLSKYSQLVLVTHNRETMSRAEVLYGVTMNFDGVSKLLSIKLEDATEYAK